MGMPTVHPMERRVLPLHSVFLAEKARADAGSGKMGSQKTPPCGHSPMGSQGGDVYFPVHSAERGIRQEAPFFRL